MKIKKRTKEEMAPKAVSENEDRYPYGLKLRLDSEQIEKMPHLKNMNVGDEVHVQGTGRLCSLSMRKTENGKESYDAEIQLEKMGCEGIEAEEDYDTEKAKGDIALHLGG